LIDGIGLAGSGKTTRLAEARLRGWPLVSIKSDRLTAF
jgi:hypothetical protein